MPIVGLIEKPRGLPGSITEPVLGPEEVAVPPAPAVRKVPLKRKPAEVA
jgi:hypothetical protein